MSTSGDLSHIPGDLWNVAGKIRGLGEILGMAGGEPPLSDIGIRGLSYILAECADQLDKVRTTYEAKQPFQHAKGD